MGYCFSTSRTNSTVQVTNAAKSRVKTTVAIRVSVVFHNILLGKKEFQAVLLFGGKCGRHKRVSLFSYTLSPK